MFNVKSWYRDIKSCIATTTTKWVTVNSSPTTRTKENWVTDVSRKTFLIELPDFTFPRIQRTSRKKCWREAKFVFVTSLKLTIQNATSEELFHGQVHNSKCLLISFMTKEGDLLIPAEHAISSYLPKTA